MVDLANCREGPASCGDMDGEGHGNEGWVKPLLIYKDVRLRQRWPVSILCSIVITIMWFGHMPQMGSGTVMLRNQGRQILSVRGLRATRLNLCWGLIFKYQQLSHCGG